MRQNATIHSLAFWLILTVANFCAAEPARKAFILHAYAHPELKILERDLLSRIQQDIPHNILGLRNLVFEDISSYADIQQWNPTSYFQDRGQRQIEKMLLARGFQMMFVFSLSYEPSHEKRRLLLTGRLYDLDKFHCISQPSAGDKSTSSPPNQLAVQNIDKLCVGVNGLQNIMDVGTVVIDNFEELSSGLRRLFAILLHVPEIDIDKNSQRVFFRPYENIVTTFRLNSNGSVADFGYWLSPALENLRAVIGKKEILFKSLVTPSSVLYGTSQMKQLSDGVFRVNAELYEIDNWNALGEQMCRHPDSFFGKLTEFGFNRTLRYSEINVKRIIDPLVEAVIVPKENNLEGFGKTVVNVPPVAGNYILRFNFGARDSATGRSIISYPSYRCFRIRETPLTLMFGFAFTGFLPPLPPLPMNASATGAGSSIGIELGVMRGQSVSGTPWFLPALYWGGVLTGAFAWGEGKISAPILGTDTGYELGLKKHFIDTRFRVIPVFLRLPSWLGASPHISGVIGLGVGATYVERSLLRWESTDSDSGMPGPLVDTGIHDSNWHPYGIIEAGGALFGETIAVQIVYEKRFLFNGFTDIAGLYPVGTEPVGTQDESVSFRVLFGIPLQRPM